MFCDVMSLHVICCYVICYVMCGDAGGRGSSWDGSHVILVVVVCNFQMYDKKLPHISLIS